MLDYRCPECHSGHIYWRFIRKEYACQKCGNRFKKEQLKELLTPENTKINLEGVGKNLTK